MAILNKTRKLLRKAFPPPSRIHLEDGESIYGTITSPHFRGMDFRARQDTIWDLLDANLNLDERRQIAFILALAPGEKVATVDPF